MLRGLATVTFYADDLVAASRWYTDLFGSDPYFVYPDPGQPAYIEYRIGDYQHELGIIASRFSPHNSSPSPAGAIAYWHVDDLQATYDTLLAMGATTHEPPTERGLGAGFVTASVVDPFGNILGIMYNPHYVEVAGAHVDEQG